MLALIQARIAQHRERIAAGHQLLEQLAEQQVTVRRELEQRRGALVALQELEKFLMPGEGLPQE